MATIRETSLDTKSSVNILYPSTHTRAHILLGLFPLSILPFSVLIRIAIRPKQVVGYRTNKLNSSVLMKAHADVGLSMHVCWAYV